MKRVRFLRERLYKMKEFEVDPNEPDRILSDGEVFENETDEGVWNEYYRVGIIDTDDDYVEQDDMFSETAQDFYNLAEAQKAYSEMTERVKKENAEAEIESRVKAGLEVPKELLRERYC